MRSTVELAERLCKVAPAGLSRVVYSDSGYGAIEVALDLAVLWWRLRGEPGRSSFICLEGAHHGEALSSASVRVRGGDPADLDRLLALHGRSVAAVIMEPLAQGDPQMLMARPGYLREVRQLCDVHGVLLICDEVGVELGLTGRMFACLDEGVAPDLLCIEAGLAAGRLSVAATLCTEDVFASLDSGEDERPSFVRAGARAADPSACAATLIALERFERERTLERLEPKVTLLARTLAQRVSVLPTVRAIRQRGLVVCVALAPAGGRATAATVVVAADRRGLDLQAVGDVVVLSPPLDVTETELRRAVAVLASSIAESAIALPAAA